MSPLENLGHHGKSRGATFLNSDVHNVHAVTKLNKAFNVPMTNQGQKFTRFLSKPEIIKIKCDVTIEFRFGD